jgi:hypothetical protein
MNKYFLIQFAIGAGTTVAALMSYKKYADWDGSNLTNPIKKYEPTIAATLLWALLFYIFLFHQSVSGFMQKAALTAKAKKDGTKPPSMASIKYGSGGGLTILRANRTVANTMEQSFPFLVGLWLHAVMLNPLKAAQLGWAWIAVRAFYPLVFGRGPILFSVTVINYVCIVAFFWPLF